jgi:peptide/nickel transport system ATP-binding protein
MTTERSGAGAFSSAPLLEVKNLNVEYRAANGTVHALTDVSITLARGQILGLAGESGSGKTTLGYAITRLLKPPAAITNGEILYYPSATAQTNGSQANGARAQALAELDAAPGLPVDILDLSPAHLRAFRWSTLAIVFQSAMNALNPVLSLGTQLEDVLRHHRPDMGKAERRARALELLRLVGIAPDRIHSYPHELSGGMRQRSIIAMALALSPEIVIMDEPTTALDVVVQREILQKIIGLRNDFGFSVIFITHDLSLLLELADTIAIMYAGRIVETATCRELQRQPRHPYSYGMLHSFPSLHGPRRKMTGIPGSPPDLRNTRPGCAFQPRCPMALDACASTDPLLQRTEEDAPTHLVSCHLYNRALATEPYPTSDDFAMRYEAAFLSGRRGGKQS